LTVKQSKHLEDQGLNPNEWLLCKRALGVWTLEHKRTLELKEIPEGK
jgi:hypothetical protein